MLEFQTASRRRGTCKGTAGYGKQKMLAGQKRRSLCAIRCSADSTVGRQNTLYQYGCKFDTSYNELLVYGGH